MMELTKFKVNKAKALEIMDYYKATEINDTKHPYDLFIHKTKDGIVVKGFKTKNPDVFTITFFGADGKASLEASIFMPNVKVETSSFEYPNIKAQPLGKGYEDTGIQIGSDEVGVGDFFGPMIVTAAYFTPSDMKLIDKLHVKDSKKLTDAYMMQIGPELRRSIKHFTILCSASKVSSYEDKGFSTHWVLAHLHNLAHQKLIEKYKLGDEIVVYVDQFEREELYKKYVGESLIENPIIFKVKGESRWPSVAIASVISRYEFLLYWQQMESKLGITIPKGAGSDVDKVYKRLIESKGKETVDKYVKTFFRNYKKTNE